MVDVSGATVYLVYEMRACDECVPAHQFFAGEMEWTLHHVASTRARAEAWIRTATGMRSDPHWWWHITTDIVDITSAQLEEDNLESWNYRPDGTPISTRESDRLYVEPIFGPWDVRSRRGLGGA